MKYNEVYEVDEANLIDYTHHAKRGPTVLETNKFDDGTTEFCIMSVKRDIKLCARVVYPDNTSKCYIFDDLEPDEVTEWEPPMQITLTDPKKVQYLFDYINEKAGKN